MIIFNAVLELTRVEKPEVGTTPNDSVRVVVSAKHQIVRSRREIW